MAFTRDGDRVVGTGSRLRVAFDAGTGAIVSLRNLVTGQELLEADVERVPWRLIPQGVVPLEDDTAAGLIAAHRRSIHVAYDERPQFPPGPVTITDTASGIRLSWETEGTRVEVDVELGVDLRMTPRVLVDEGVTPPESLVFPVLTGLRELDGDDRLLFPQHSGWLVSRPLQTGGFSGPYPDGLFGCTLQATAYFASGVGGFYLATHDPSSTSKGFAFGPNGWVVTHDHWDLRDGTSMDLGYPVVIDALERGDWYEAADRYRSWVLPNAPWCADGPRHEQVRVRWLHDEVGLVIWCPPSTLDWSPWLRDYCAAAGTPVHIVPGWDWPAELPPTTDHWFPAHFHPSNVEAYQGHRVTPYMNDLFIHADDLDEWGDQVIEPKQPFTWSFFRGDKVPDGEGKEEVLRHIDYRACPAASRFADLHERRNLTLCRDYDMHGVCYDISSGNPPARCLNADHGHPPGWGRDVVTANNDLNARTHRAVHEATGAYPALGNEGIIENIIPSMDFYTARAIGGPLGALEAFIGGRERPPGEGHELVPYFDAVYHDYAPVREDVWCEISKRQGDIYYWTSARCVLVWGGILSLHYAINWPGPGHGPESAEFIGWDGGHYVSNVPLPEDDPGKLAFLAELAAARTGYGNRYLGWGRLLPPPSVDGGTVSLSYEFEGDWRVVDRNLFPSGSWDVPRVTSARWEDPDGNVGVFLCNVGPDPVTVELDPSWGTTVTSRAGSAPAESKLEIAPRTIVLIDG